MAADYHYTQQHRALAIRTPLGDDALLLRSFDGQEAISRLFRYSLELLSEDGSIPFQGMIGQNITVRILLADQSPRYWNGVVSRFSQGAQDRRFASYRAEMVPWLWFLTRTADCRIFQNKTVPEIAQQIFREQNFHDYSLRLFGHFGKREYCVQYRETDFNFLSRLLEDEGIYYFFEHGERKHTLVLANHPYPNPPCAHQWKVRYGVSPSGSREEGVALGCTVQEEVRSGRWTYADYDFEKPSSSLLVAISSPQQYEVYDYPGNYRSRAEGDALARIRLEEQLVPRLVLSGDSDCRTFVTGHTFDLVDHYREELNQRWLLTEVGHSASQDDFDTVARTAEVAALKYANTFESIPADAPFRPQRTTPHPRIDGCQTAVVVGPPGETIHPDQFGRVKVQFHWDREGKRDDNSSCWIRVTQPWAGSGWGGMFIPHVGQEVVVSYEDGNPDRPLVTGRLYNAATMPNIGLPAGKTQSVLGDHGGNHITMEGVAGKQQIKMGSPTQGTFMTIGAANSPEGFNFGSGAHMNRELGGNDLLSAAGNQLSKITGNVDAITGGSKTSTVAGSIKAAISGKAMDFIGGSGTSVIAGRSSINVGGSRTEVIAGSHSIVNPKLSIRSASKCSVVAGTTINQAAPKISVAGGSKVSVKAGGPITQQAGGAMTVKAGGAIKQQADGPVTLKSGGAIKQQAEGPINLKSDGPINQEGSAINVKGPTKIKGDTKVSGDTKINGNTLTISS